MFKIAEIYFLKSDGVGSAFRAKHCSIIYILFLLDSVIVLKKVHYLLDRS